MNAIQVHRLQHWCYRNRVPLVDRLIHRLFRSSTRRSPPETEIGDGTWFAYGTMGVVIHGKARIGRNVLIAQQVTVGGRFGKTTFP